MIPHAPWFMEARLGMVAVPFCRTLPETRGVA